MKKYNQLNLHQRYQIQALLETEISKSEIAKILLVVPCTIYRELSRNIAKRSRTAGKYVASNAQRRADTRHRNKAKQIMFTKPLKERIAGLLRYEKWSPELNSKRLELDEEACLSHEKIYRWIWDVKKSNKKTDLKFYKLYKNLRHGIRRQKMVFEIFYKNTELEVIINNKV